MTETRKVQHEMELRDFGKATVTLLPQHEGRVVAVSVGDIGSNPLVRVHSRCLYGEVFHSLGCDCEEQLAASFETFQGEGGGILIYLDQEGRGAGLLAKAQAYSRLETSGVDTFTAYREMGLDEDPRSYEEAAELMVSLGLSEVRLLTNNPNKISALEDAGVVVHRMPMNISAPPQAQEYLLAKAAHGHFL